MEMDSSMRHRRTASSDRFLFFPSTNNATAEVSAADELNEDDVLWTVDFTAPNDNNYGDKETSANKQFQRIRPKFPNNSGIFSALSGTDHGHILYRKALIPHSQSSSCTKTIPSVRRPPAPGPGDRELVQSLPSRKFQQSAPMAVPLISIAMAKRRNSKFMEKDDVDREEEMLPPHEIVARGSARDHNSTFSVLEGVGRTLKGRDLRQVRNAVWRRTGFLD